MIEERRLALRCSLSVLFAVVLFVLLRNHSQLLLITFFTGSLFISVCFRFFFYICIFIFFACLSGARCQVPGYSSGHAHKASPPTAFRQHFTWHFKFTIYIKWRNASAKTTTVVKWNCSALSPERLRKRIGLLSGLGPGPGLGPGSKAPRLSSEIRLKTNFVYVKYINYVFKWLL